MSSIITAYCICRLCCGKHASLPVNIRRSRSIPGLTVAGPRRYPLGTRVRIDDRIYTITDRTAVRYDGRWDILMRNHQEARNFGRKKVTVKVIK